MKIKLAIVCLNEKYLKRLSQYLMEQYPEKFELLLFSNAENAIETSIKNHVDLILVDEELKNMSFDLPDSIALAFLTDNNWDGSINGNPAICRYQKISQIYQEILNIYIDRIENTAATLKRSIGKDQKVITFFSPAGGVGTSVAAVSYAKSLAFQGKNVLYLNLENAGGADLYFDAYGEENFSRVIYELAKDGKSTILKIENSMKQDSSGVFYFSNPDSSLDMLDMNEEMYEKLFEVLSRIEKIDWIIVDMEFNLNKLFLEQIKRSYFSIVVSDGSMHSNKKVFEGMHGLELLCGAGQDIKMNQVGILYNHFNSKRGKKIADFPFKEIGLVGRIENASDQELTQLISQNKVFMELFQ